MDLNTIVIIILAIVTVALYPAFPYSRGWGYMPFTTALVVLIMLIAWGMLERT